MDLNKDMIDLYKQSRPKLKPAVELQRLTSFNQLYGIEYVEPTILKIVDLFKRAVDGRDELPDSSVLIYGSKGLGKTAIVEAAADYAQMKLISFQMSQISGSSRNEFKEFLEQLKRHSIGSQPAVVLIDNLEEIDDKAEYKHLRRTILDLVSNKHKLLVFCATSSNLDGLLDIVFPYTLHLKRPSTDARFKILQNLQKKNDNLALLSEEDLQVVAKDTPSFTALNLHHVLYIARTESGGRPTMQHCKIAIEMIKQSLKQGTHLIGEKPTITWNDIGGMRKVREDFAVILEEAHSAGDSSKFAGIALYGPPGCGKTMVAQAMANEAGFNFISIKPTELVDKFLGETEKNIRRVFHEAQEFEPCIIYFDEFDGLCGKRGSNDTLTKAIQTLLSEMDGFARRGRSIILVSTNRLEDIDKAMLRPGRLSEKIFVGPPDQKARRDILRVVTNRPGLSLADDVDLDYWAEKTENFTGAELDFMVTQAIRRAKKKLGGDGRKPISQEHMKYAMKRIQHANQEVGEETRSMKRTKLE